MKIYNILTDEVIDLCVTFGTPNRIKVKIVLVTPLFKSTHVADWCIEPNIKIGSWVIGDFEAKVWGIARNVPTLEPAFDPLSELVGDF